LGQAVGPGVPGASPRLSELPSPRTIVAAITDLDVAQAILEHLGLPTEQPVLHAARAPPQLELKEFFDSDQRPD
jgi:hypothetical protein